MNCDKVGRKEWKDLKVGETGTFTLPDELAVENARVAAQDVKRLYHYNLERVKTDDALTISFKRLS